MVPQVPTTNTNILFSLQNLVENSVCKTLFISAEPPVQDPAEVLSRLFEASPPLQTARQGKVNKIFSIADGSSPIKLMKYWNCETMVKIMNRFNFLSFSPSAMPWACYRWSFDLHSPSKTTRLNKNHHQKSTTTQKWKWSLDHVINLTNSKSATSLFCRCTALGVSSPPLPFLPPGPSYCTSSAMLSLMRCCFLDNHAIYW